MEADPFNRVLEGRIGKDKDEKGERKEVFLL